jgi:hypothetical protein
MIEIPYPQQLGPEKKGAAVIELLTRVAKPPGERPRLLRRAADRLKVERGH